MACAIDGAGDVEQHDFTGAPGERVYARVVRLSGDPTLVPSVSVLDSEGSPACPDVKECVLEVAGRHTLVVQDGFLKQVTGEYALYLQRRNDPLGCGELSVGEAVDIFNQTGPYRITVTCLADRVAMGDRPTRLPPGREERVIGPRRAFPEAPKYPLAMSVVAGFPTPADQPLGPRRCRQLR